MCESCGADELLPVRGRRVGKKVRYVVFLLLHCENAVRVVFIRDLNTSAAGGFSSYSAHDRELFLLWCIWSVKTPTSICVAADVYYRISDIFMPYYSWISLRNCKPGHLSRCKTDCCTHTPKKKREKGNGKNSLSSLYVSNGINPKMSLSAGFWIKITH